MKRTVQAIVMASFVGGGCTSVKLVQRDGCWIRETSGFLRGAKEDIGPCTPPESAWSDDRLTRVVQECIARTEYHWQTRALIAWNQNLPLPERASEGSVLQDCVSETSRAMAADIDRLRQQNDLLSAQVRDIGGERDALRKRADDASSKLLASHEKLADRLLGDHEKLGEGLLGAQGKLAEYLGEAAKKQPAPAVATATATSNSDGTATNDAATSSDTASTLPAAVVAKAPADAAKPVRRARTPRSSVKAKPVACPSPEAKANSAVCPPPEAKSAGGP